MPNRKQKIEGTLYREIEMRAGSVINEEDRTVRVSVSSELPVLRSSFFRDPWLETLGHNDDEVDLNRLNNGAAVLYNHSRDRADRIGVVENATIRNKRVEATLRISKREDVSDIWQDIKDRVLKNISVGYSIDERTLTREEKGEPSEYRITSWTPHEVSFVDIPADPSVGVGRDESGELMYRVHDIGDSTMPKKITNIDDALKQGAAQERARVSEINEIFAPYPDFETARTRSIDDGITAEDSRKLLLEELGRNSFPVGGDAMRPGEFRDGYFSQSDRRDGDDFRQAAADSLSQRANISVAMPHAGAQDLVARSLVDIAGFCLGRNGINDSRMTNAQKLERAFTTSDFPLILQDAANKSVLTGYELSPATHTVVTRQTTAPNFLTQYKVAASAAPDLKLINEDGEYTYSGVTEVGAAVALATYGRLMAVSRQNIINDALNEIYRALQSAGTAIARLQSDIVWGLITSNVTMPDGDALFHANHNNISTAAALTVASLGDMKRLMRLQQAPKLNATDVIYLDLQPFVLVVPPSLETTAEQLLNSINDPANANNTFNPFAHKLRLVVEPRLETDSTTRYYVMADPNVFSWFDRVGLEGQENGFLGQQDGWSIDGTEFKVRNDFAAVVNDYRGAVKNDGV